MHYLTFATTLGAAFLLVLPALAQTPPAKKQPVKPLAAAAPAAPQPKRLGTTDGWTAYTSPEANGHICYLVGSPTKSEPANLKRNAVHVLVTHNTADKTSNVVSFVAGYPFKDQSDADLDVGGKKFSLFTKDDTAWARDSATDKAVVEAMQKGKTATIKGSSARGTATTDVYSLAGFAPALAEIDKACKVKR
ncbi:MAG: hypothetical protein JWL84_4008 [Rhodospirillales bacterium]|jgi:invasion protein IalB|nr:hypothetical protein [Rhodospirillales bacterium]